MSEDTRFKDLSTELKSSMGSAGHIAIFNLIANQLIAYHNNQEQTYKLSFSKRGEIGVWMNLGRKMDRLDPIAERLFEESGNSSLLVDVLVDMAIYAIKWLAVIYEIRPEDLQNWVATTYATTMRMPPDQALELFEIPINMRKVPVGEIHEGEAGIEVTERVFEAYAKHIGMEVDQLTPEDKNSAFWAINLIPETDEDREEL